MSWRNIQGITSQSFTCGFCGNGVASSQGFFDPEKQREIYVCPHCQQPTYVDENGIHSPGVAPGVEVENVPEQLDHLYREARNCVAIGSNTSAVLTCRKILMNIAVEQGAEEGKSFLTYVEYLANSGFVPPNGRGWVDHIRKKGNEATHEIYLMSSDDAKELILFIEMLLKFIYEFPARVPRT
nr:DUF4145 domain-containing protein [uncultured Methylophaga sp.]